MAADKKATKGTEKGAKASPDASAETSVDTGAGDDTRRRFEEALARKRGRAGGGGNPHDPGRTVVPQSNTKRQKTFRRKSGG
jgi:hypothetical protein